jgi:hypothetical protein
VTAFHKTNYDNDHDDDDDDGGGGGGSGEHTMGTISKKDISFKNRF